MGKGKLKTPGWITEGFDSKEEWEKARQKAEPLANSSKLGQVKGIKNKKTSGKTFRLRVCPECGSNKVSVILGNEEGKGTKGWECKKCNWKGRNINIKEVSEDEFLEMEEQ